MSTSANKDVKIAPGAVVCVESKLRGSITVGSMTVIHPKASLIAESGPIIVGENNIMEEQSSIIHSSTDSSTSEKPTPLIIGVNNVFEVGCEIHAKSIGNHNVFEPKCYVGPEVEIGNGCIIGAGCHITLAEKLPDQTVITGRKCIRNVALDKPPGSDDLIRQQDELTVMSEIFTQDEFSMYKTDGEVCAVFQAYVDLPLNFTLLLTKDTAQTDFQIRHLPPIRLTASLPPDYPSTRPPDYIISCCWLSKHKLNHIATQLQQLWEENLCEILFIWCSFLKDQLLVHLNLTESYDLIEKSVIEISKMNQRYAKNQTKSFNKSSCFQTAHCSRLCNDEKNNNNFDCHKKRNTHVSVKRCEEETCFCKEEKLVQQSLEQLEMYHRQAVNGLYFHLIEYNATKSKEEFKKALQYCNVCFSNVLGESCKQLTCGHVTCSECLKRMCEINIKHGTVESIVCPQEGCGLEILPNLIKELVPKELFEHFDKLMLDRTLDKMSNMTYCPLRHCQYPVSTQGDEALALCPNCNHAFCIFCKRAYHGIEGCKLKSEEKLNLIEAYQNANTEKRLELEKRYGKKQLAELVNEAQSEQWMSENSKKCPCCHINIEKNDGCNKMICRKCNTNFCWICLIRLSSLNPYLHFQDPRSRCFNLLFEGMYQDNEQDIDEDIEAIEGEEN